MYARSLVALSLFVSVGCASHEGSESSNSGAKPPVTEPEIPEKPEQQKKVATVSIASVTMIEDCPQFDPKPVPAADEPVPAADEPPPPAAEPEHAARGRRAMPAPGATADSNGRGFVDSCTQSTLQLAFSADGEQDGAFVIKSIRVLDAKGDKPVGSVNARLPMTWTPEGSYAPWDERVLAGKETKASYRLSIPNWLEVEKKIGGSSFGHTFMLEMDVEIDGQAQTVRSSQFPREEPHAVVT